MVYGKELERQLVNYTVTSFDRKLSRIWVRDNYQVGRDTSPLFKKDSKPPPVETIKLDCQQLRDDPLTPAKSVPNGFFHILLDGPPVMVRHHIVYHDAGDLSRFRYHALRAQKREGRQSSKSREEEETRGSKDKSRERAKSGGLKKARGKSQEGEGRESLKRGGRRGRPRRDDEDSDESSESVHE